MNVSIREGFSSVEVVIKCPKSTDEIQRLASLLQGYEQRLSGMKDGQTFLIDRNDVFYFESVDKRCFIYTATDVYETALKLYEIEDRPVGNLFFRISKSQILNIKKIKSLCPEFGGRIEAVLENGEILMVSRQYAKSFKERLGLR